jgi:hypothetical protein
VRLACHADPVELLAFRGPANARDHDVDVDSIGAEPAAGVFSGGESGGGEQVAQQRPVRELAREIVKSASVVYSATAKSASPVWR